MTDTDETPAQRSNARKATRENAAGATENRRTAGFTRRNVIRATAGAVGAAALTASAGANGEATCDVMATCNAADGSVSLVDARTHDHIRTVSVYPDEDEEDALEDATVDQFEPEVLNAWGRENYIEHVNVSPDGRTLYAARGHVGDVVAIDVESGEKIWETELDGVRADHQKLSPDGRYLFTSDIVVDQVDKIDAETGEIVAEGIVRQQPHGNHYHHLPAFDDEAVLVNGSLGNMVVPDSETGDPAPHRLTFLDPDTMETLRTAEFEEGVRPFAITHDGRKAYVQVSYFHGFHEYDIDEDRVTRTKELPKTEHVPEDEDDYPLQSAHHGIDISGDGEYICAAGTTSWYVAIVRRSDFELVDTIEVGEHPYWVRTAPDGEHAFVPVRGDDEVAVINYEAAKEVGRVSVGSQPHVTEYGAIPRDIL